MQNYNRPTIANGKICYIEIPAVDINLSAAFFNIVFGWSLRKNDDGSISFDDGAGEVSGMWVTGLKIGTEPGLIISIMVYSIVTTVKSIIENGGQIHQQEKITPSSKTALFRDPAGNLFSIYQSNRSKG
jgi:uncharacterized protein